MTLPVFALPRVPIDCEDMIRERMLEQARKDGQIARMPADLQSHTCDKRAARHEAVRALHASGKRAVEIAAELGVPKPTIWQDFCDLGLSASAPDRGAIHARRAKVRDLHAAGWSMRAMSKKLGVADRTIRSDIDAMGLTPNGRS